MRPRLHPAAGSAAPATPPGSRVWVLGALAVVLAVVAVVGLIVVPGRGRAEAAAGGATAAAAPSVAEVDAVLGRHAAALLHRDRAAYAADLSSLPAATQFRATQLAAFDHTEGVPFASFDLRYDRAVVDPPSVAAARARLGDGSATIVRADLDYAFDGVDARPATHVVYLTLVRAGFGWALAGDTDLATAGGVSWRGPWDFGPLVLARARTGLVLAHPATDDSTGIAAAQAEVVALAADLDAAVDAVTGVWGGGWPQRVAVVVARHQDEMDAIAGPGYPVDAVAAVAAAEPTTSVTEGPDVGAGQRVVMSGPLLPGLSAVGRSVLLRHELTHVATRAVTSSDVPTWVVEGFADYVGNLAGTQPVRTVAAELAAQVAAGGAPTALPDAAAFVPSGGAGGDTGTTGTTGGDRSAAAAYEQAWFAFRTVAALGGPAAPAAFYRAVGSAVLGGADPAAAVDAALRATTGTDTATFTARWRAEVAAALT